MLGLVLGVELCIACHEADISNITEWIWRIEGEAASGPEARAEVLLLGDSLIRGGVSPLIVSNRLERSVRTLALPGCGPAGQYYVLKRVIESGGRPKAVVVEYLPKLLHNPPDYQARCWAEFLTVREAFHLARTTRQVNTFTAICLNKLVPSIRDRYELRGFVRDTLQHKWWNRRFALQVVVWHTKRNHGGHVLQNVAGVSVPPDAKPAHRVAYPEQWRCLPSNELYVRKLLDLAARRAIPVYWLMPPFLPAVQSAAKSAGDDARFGGFVAQMAASYPKVIVLDCRSSDYEPEAFADAVHLSARGNARLSADLSDCLAHTLRTGVSAPRWVRLPRYRPAPEEADLEDFQKALALRLPKGKGAAGERRKR